MAIAYLVVTAVFAVICVCSATLKLVGNPMVVQVIHETVGVPMKYLPLLAACEIAGALGLVAGYWYPPLGLAAAIGLVTYFVGAVVSHLRVGDFTGVGNAAFMLGLAVAALFLRTVRM
jgi:hypothetical protein